LKKQYIRKAKKGKDGQGKDILQDAEIQVIMPSPHIPKKSPTIVLPINYKSMSQEECKDAGLSCSYSRRSNSTDPRFHERTKQEFYETVLLKKKSKVVRMRFVDWPYISSKEL
jgi:hypothetical protein